MGHLLTAFLSLFFVDPLAYLVFFLLWFTFIYLAVKKKVDWSLYKGEEIFLPLLALFALGLLCGPWAADKATWLAYLGKDLHYLLFLAFAVYLFKVNNCQERWLKSIMFATSLLVVYGFYEYFFVRTVTWYRLKSFYGNPNHFGGVLIMTLPFFFALALDWTKEKKQRILASLFSLAGIFMLVFTQSRSSWLALLAGLFITIFLRNWKIALVFVLVLGLSFSLVYPVLPGYLKKRMASVVSWHETAGRIDLWQAGLLMWQEKPLLGVGTGGYTYLLNNYLSTIKGRETKTILTLPHNIYIYILAEHGLVGLSIFIYFLVLLGKKAYRLAKNLKEDNYFLGAGVLASLGALAVHLLTDQIITNRAIGMLALFFLALFNHLVDDLKTTREVA